MERLNTILGHLTADMQRFDEKANRKNGANVRKTLQQLKNECHSLRKEVLERTKSPVPPVVEEPVAPVVEEPVAPVVEEPEPVESHPVPESKPSPVEKKEKKKRKRKKVVENKD